MEISKNGQFHFNFQIEEEENNQSSCKSPKFEKQYVPEEVAVEVFPAENILSQENFYKINSTTLNINDLKIVHINSGPMLKSIANCEKYRAVAEAEEKFTDLIPGVYEGGAKIWECTSDLLKYMIRTYDSNYLKEKTLLDLGCGSGVLGIYGVILGAVVHFQDYNIEVLQNITIPNVLLNLHEKSLESITKSKFFAGDWGKFNDLTANFDKFDLILTSETIYNPNNYERLLDTLKCKIKPNGIIFLAAKTYYFGVGGGLREFEEYVKQDGFFSTNSIWKSSIDVCREIIEMKCRNQH